LKSIDGVDIVTPVHPNMCSGLTTFKVAGVEGRKIQDTLWEQEQIHPRTLHGNRGVRYSTHIYNSIEENERALGVIGELTRH
jgi:selenocysteine lyase/cysteine desulfurase